MSEPFLGEIRLFGGTFAPQYWADCDGSLLSIQRNEALFALIGVTYGGDGGQTFALPDLRGRVPVGMGQGPGLSVYVLGQSGGLEQVSLTAAQMPAHTHTMAKGSGRAVFSPAGALPADARSGQAGVRTYGSPDGPTTALHPGSLTVSGGSQPHPNMQPSLTIRYIIALAGIWPSRD